MNRWWCFLFVVLAAVVLTLPLGPALSHEPQADHPQVAPPPEKKAGAPQLQFAETTFDFGEIYQDAEVDHRFRFQNIGSGELKIAGVRSTCGCTAAVSSASAIPPGESGEIVVTFNSAGFAGPITRTIEVLSNDPERSYLTLQLTGQVKTVLTVTPPRLVFLVYKEELPKSLPPVQVEPNPGQAFEITRVESSSASMKPTVTSLSPEQGRGYRLTVELDPSIPIGHRLKETVRLYTTHPQKPVVTVRIHGDVYGERPISAEPPALAYGLLRPDEERSLTVILSRGGQDDWKLLRAETEPEAVPAQVAVRRTGANYEVTVSVHPTRPLEGFRGLLHLVTDHPQQPRVSVPFYGWTYADAPFALSPDLSLKFQGLVASVLQDQAVPVEEVLAKALGGVRDKRALDLLTAVLQKGDWVARMRAVEALGALGHPETFAVLEAAVHHDPDEDVRDQALQALFQLTPERAREPLLYALADKDAWVRETAATLLGTLGDQQTIPRLLEALTDPDEDVREAAAKAVKRLKGDRPQSEEY